MQRHDKEELFNKLYSIIDGYALSQKAQKKLAYEYKGNVYGEVTYPGFVKMLAMVRPKRREVFYDLGSGVGKAVILASLLADFGKLTGVEILEDLHKAAESVLVDYKRQNPQKNIQFIHNDFHNVDFSDADVIYMNATLFHYELNLPMLNKLSKLKKGARIITNGIALEIPSFTSQFAGYYPFTWGDDAVFIHHKIY